MAREVSNRYDSIKRRNIIKAAGGAAGFGVLAGCLGDGNGDGDDGSTGSGSGSGGTSSDGNPTGPGDFVDQRATFYTSYLPNNPQESHWNPLSPVGSIRPYFGHAKFGHYSPFSGEFLMTGIEDFQKEGDTLSLHLRDHHTWAPSGDPVTADDLRTKFVLEDWIVGSQLRSVVDEYVVASEKQLDLVLSNDALRPELFMGSFVGDWIDMKHSVYREWVEAFEDATSDSEREDIQQEVVEFRWENGDVELSGQFQPPELRENSILYEVRRDDGKPHAGSREGFPNETLYTELELHVVPRGQTEYQLVRQGDSILTNYRGHAAELAPAENNDDLLTAKSPTFASYVLQPNHSADHLDDVAVRKAIAYALDLERAAEVAMSNNLAPITSQSGVLGAMGPDEYAHPDFQGTYDFSYTDYITDVSFDSFTDYGTEPKMDEAVAVLQDAGYQRNSDDLWEDESGNVVGPNLLSSDIADFFLNQTLEWVSSLQELGFDTEIDSLPYDQFFDRLGNADYDMTIVAWQPSAPFGYSLQSTTWQISARRDTPPTGWVAEDPITANVPDYGDASADPIEVNVTEKLNQAQFESDEEESNRLISELAWAANESLPTIFCGEIADTVVADNDNFQWPEPQSAEWPMQWWQDAIDRGVPLPRE